ncbi:MAG: hypothetical protein ACREYE_15120, partial [Gammaproteobacteria bacterium]
ACAGVPARIFAATISCPSCTPKAATDDIKNLSGIHADLPEGHCRPGLCLPSVSTASRDKSTPAAAAKRVSARLKGPLGMW